jgi:MATE family multidrug resistance protein
MVFAIAAPMTLAFLTTPILGIVDTAVIGQFGDAALIGGLAVGAIIFDIVFTTLNFLRSGTTGFVAQAFGREDETEQQAVFWRAVILAAGLGLALLLLAWPIRELGILLMNPGPGVAEATRTYVTIRMFAAPFSLINYAILGLLLGQGRAMARLLLQTLLNGINIAARSIFRPRLGWAIEGVAFGTILGEAIAAAAGFWWIMRGFDRAARRHGRMSSSGRVPAPRLGQPRHHDPLLRAAAGFSLFTRTGAQFGAVTLAANAILMNFFMIAGYYLDGFATAAEQIVGRAIGAQPPAGLLARRPADHPVGLLAGRLHHRVRAVRRPGDRLHDDGGGRARGRADLSALGGGDGGGRRARLPDGRRLYRRHLVARHAQHDAGLAGASCSCWSSRWCRSSAITACGSRSTPFSARGA